MEVSRRDGSGRTVGSFSTRTYHSQEDSIDPFEGARWLFWTDWGENPRIERVSMSGQNRSVIIRAKIFGPNGLTVDILNKRIYFADSKLDYIDFCNYDGTGQ
ncbi:hypothetical protein Pmani_007343 [Petrolisthes manimaculis]|uniref:Uncharacterized protein n=1 Tax=Petrolisthes manimaculis TaxID=1843537 RepID=A0AAE1Q966_9EUCA|nr:hypothetical protein Pmani_007343 [Petrolisthes manimaculis]